MDYKPPVLETPKKSKTVSFNNNVKVVLIPTRVEYYKAGLVKTLWYSLKDYYSIRLSAMNELIGVMDTLGVDGRTARTILYDIPGDSDDSKEGRISSSELAYNSTFSRSSRLQQAYQQDVEAYIVQEIELLHGTIYKPSRNIDSEDFYGDIDTESCCSNNVCHLDGYADTECQSVPSSTVSHQDSDIASMSDEYDACSSVGIATDEEGSVASRYSDDTEEDDLFWSSSSSCDPAIDDGGDCVWNDSKPIDDATDTLVPIKI